jgi:hypothetical protein
MASGIDRPGDFDRRLVPKLARLQPDPAEEGAIAAIEDRPGPVAELLEVLGVLLDQLFDVDPRRRRFRLRPQPDTHDGMSEDPDVGVEVLNSRYLQSQALGQHAN